MSRNYTVYRVHGTCGSNGAASHSPILSRLRSGGSSIEPLKTSSSPIRSRLSLLGSYAICRAACHVFHPSSGVETRPPGGRERGKATGMKDCGIGITDELSLRPMNHGTPRQAAMLHRWVHGTTVHPFLEDACPEFSSREKLMYAWSWKVDLLRFFSDDFWSRIVNLVEYVWERLVCLYILFLQFGEIV